MSTTGGDPDGVWRELVTARAREVVAATNPYDPARQIFTDIDRALVAPDFAGSHDRAGSVMALWLELTDAVDGPTVYARGRTPSDVDRLMRQAAREWLALAGDSKAVDEYIRRWWVWSELA